MIIPPVKVVDAGRIVPDVFRLILAQIRSKHETAGDLRAQIAANATGVRRLQALVGRHGLETIVATMRELLDYTERRTRAEIGALPHGVYEAEGTVDIDGYSDEPVRLRARVEITAGGVRFDLSGSDPQRRAPVNSTYAQTFSACAYAVKCLIDPDLPVNDGFYRVVSRRRAAGTVTNCTWPSPVVGGWETQTRLVDVIFRALLPSLPERLPAGTKAMMCHAGFGGVDAETNEYYCFLETFGGGYGGRFASDGPDAVQTHGQNTENAPVEETELNYPVRIARLSLVEDSDGPGPLPRGLGLRKDFVFDRATTFTVLADRTLAGPAGAFGGRAGKPAEYVLIRGGAETRLGAKMTIEVQPGDTVSFRTCGGGGYGPPLERDRELVARDVREGKVSAERARGRRGWAGRRPHLLRGDPERARRGDRRDGARPEAERLLDQHQDALRLLLRLLRRAASLGGAGLRAAGAPRLDGRAGAEGRSRTYGAENLGPGDVLVTNDPHPSGVHLNDVSLISPVYHERRADRLRREPGAPRRRRRRRARVDRRVPEVFQEGVIIPPVKLVANGVIVKDVFKLILAQIRSKHETAGDFRAQIAANATGVRRVTALVDRHGRETILATMAELLEYTERRTRAEIAGCPQASTRRRASSTTTATRTTRSACSARRDRGRRRPFDTTGSDAQRRAPVNSTYAMSFSACAYALKCLIDPDLPVNDGFYRLVHLDAPPGTVTNCTWPAPVVGGWETHDAPDRGDRQGAAAGVPRAAPRGDEGDDVPGGLRLAGRRGRQVHVLLRHVRGRLRRPLRERRPRRGPVARPEHGERPDRGDRAQLPGAHQRALARRGLGGAGTLPRRPRAPQGLPLRPAHDLHRACRPRPGRAVGRVRRPHRADRRVRARPRRRRDEAVSKTTLDLVPGDVISVRTCGGGGYGPPEERDPERVLRDVLEGKVSAERARDIYRVAISDRRLDAGRRRRCCGG